MDYPVFDQVVDTLEETVHDSLYLVDLESVTSSLLDSLNQVVPLNLL